MSALASLLSRDQVVPVRKIEEAIQRQVLSGGELDTVLLEIGAVPENVMAGYRAALYGLDPATRQELMEASPDVVRLVPRDVAERHRMVPIAVEGRALVVALAKPPSHADLEQIGFLLGYELQPRIATEARLAMALAHHYGVGMAPRIRRLQKKLEERDPGTVPHVEPPEDNRIEASRLELPSKEEEARQILSEPPAPEGRSTKRFGTVAASPEPEGAGRQPGQASSEPGGEPQQPPSVAVGVSRVVGVGGAAPAPADERPVEPSAAEAPPPEVRSPSEPTGPLSAQQAIERMGEAATRDEILDAFFAFARGQLEYVALFVVHEDIAEGRSAAGDGASTEELRRMAVPLDGAGAFAEARRTAGPRMTRLDQSEMDRNVAQEMRRAESQPGILVPIAIRQRVVLVLYGDRGGKEFGFSDVPDLLALTSNVGAAFERLIMRRKFRGYQSPARKSGEARLGSKTAAMPSPPSRPSRASWQPAEQGPSEPAASEPAAPERSEPAASEPAASEPAASEPSEPAPADAFPASSVASGEGSRGRPRSVRSARRTVMGLPAVDLGTEDSWGAQDRPSGPAPAGSSSEAESAPSGARPQAFTVLGVPRSAPPPPSVPSRDTMPDMPPAMERERSPAASEPGPSPAEDDEPELTVEYGDAEDAELAALEDYGPEAESGEDAGSSQDESSSDSAGKRRDLRRDDPDSAPTHDVVRLGRAAAAAAASIPRQSSQPPASSTPPADPDPGEPSVIVDMGQNVEALVRELSLSGPDDDPSVTHRVLSQGEVALPVLVQHFPGPLWFDRHRPFRRLPHGRDVSPIARALAAFGERAVPYVASVLGSRDGDTRFYALLVAADMVHPDLIEPLGRLVFDPDPGVRSVALDVLPRFSRFAEEYDGMLEGIRVFGRVPRKDPQQRVLAIDALGPLGDAKAVDTLIKLLDDDEAPAAEAAHRSLVALTRQDFGTSQKKWTAWADKHRDEHRIEWLIDALGHPDEALRSAAGDALQKVTRQYFGYHSSMSKREREVVQRRYRDWWEQEGRALFG